MEKAMILVSVLLLGWTWTLQGVPVDMDQVESSVEPPADVEGLNATLPHKPLLNATEACEKLPPPSGPTCAIDFDRYFYNSSSMGCEHYIYKGCEGPVRNFENQTECMQKCHKEEEQLPKPMCLDC